LIEKRHLEKDIRDRIINDFGPNHKAAIQLVENFEAEEGLSPRISRCIVHLAKGDIAKLETAIKNAKYDWRDVIFWAESDPLEFNRPFKNQ